MLTVEQWRERQNGTPGYSDQRIGDALSWAYGRIESTAGLEYVANNPIVATWRWPLRLPLEWRWTQHLEVRHPIDSIESVMWGDESVDEGDYWLEDALGGFGIRRAIQRGVEAVVTYYPKDDVAVRDSVASLLVSQYLGAVQMYAASFDGVTRPAFQRDFSERRLLREITANPTPANLPHSSRYRDPR